MDRERYTQKNRRKKKKYERDIQYREKYLKIKCRKRDALYNKIDTLQY